MSLSNYDKFDAFSTLRQAQGDKYIEFRNSRYFSVTTLATVGYGDLAPVISLGKAFTIVYIFAGVGIFLGLINVVGRHTEKQNPINKLAEFRENK